MRIKEEFTVEKLSGMNTVVLKPENQDKFNSTIVLSDTAVFLWDMLKAKDTSKTEMLDGLLDRFPISTVMALNDIDVFLRTMRENGILED